MLVRLSLKNCYDLTTMEDKILRTINTICLNFSFFPPGSEAML